MDTQFSSIHQTSQLSCKLCNATTIEWKSIEMIDDFVNNSFIIPSKIYSVNEQAPVDENGIPKSFTQFVA